MHKDALIRGKIEGVALLQKSFRKWGSRYVRQGANVLSKGPFRGVGRSTTKIAIRAKICYWYDKFAPHIKARTKLQAAIISACNDPENGSRMIRGFLGNGSVKSEKENEGVC